MAIGAIELGTITRSQDYITLKQNEDNKSVVQQSTILQDNRQEEVRKASQVNTGDEAGWVQKKMDAGEKGNGTYAGDGGKNRKKKKESDGKVVVKGSATGFDMKI